MTTEPTTNPFPLLVSARKQIAVGLGVLALVFAVCAIWWGLWGMSSYRAEKDAADAKDEKSKQLDELVKPKDKDKEPDAEAKAKIHSPDYLPAASWAGLMALVCLGASGWLATRESDPANPGASSRMELLAFGATSGLLIALLGLAWGLSWRESLVRWVNNNDAREAKWVFFAVAVFFIGLVVMFFSTQLGRAEQRNNVLLRRLMHGYNAVFHGILLLIVLAGINVVFFLKVPNTFVANDSAFTALTDDSKKFLASLDQDVHAYMIMPERFQVSIVGLPYSNLYADTRGLLSQAEDRSKFFKASFLSPSLDKAKINALYDELNIKDRDQLGILLVVGKDRAATTFIPAEELLEFTPNERRAPIVYQGENRLLSELAYMTDDRSKMVIYFTQDHGELSMEPGTEPERSLSGIVNFLRSRKLNVSPLKLDAAKPKIPDDAAVVIVAGPRRTISPTAPLMKALPEYLKPTSPDAKPGKLMAFLPAFRALEGKVGASGLETMLAESGIQLDPAARLVTIPDGLDLGQGKSVPPEYLLAFGTNTRHPLSPLLKNQWLLADCRPMRAAASQQNPTLKLTTLLQSPRGFPTWQETDFTTPPSKTFEALRADPGGQIFIQKKYSESAQTLGVSVGFIPAGGDPQKPPEEKPRMLVFATDTLLADRSAFDVTSADFRQQVVGGGIDWLREREASIGIKPRAVNLYLLPKPIELSSKLTLLAMITMGLTAMGVGVWYSRRR